MYLVKESDQKYYPLDQFIHLSSDGKLANSTEFTSTCMGDFVIQFTFKKQLAFSNMIDMSVNIPRHPTF